MALELGLSFSQQQMSSMLHISIVTAAYTHMLTNEIVCTFTGIFDGLFFNRADDLYPINRDLSHLETLHLRYFTPREVANLLGFPPQFSFPDTLTNRQRYALLGNSLSVIVVAKLVQHVLTHSGWWDGLAHR